MRWHKLLLSLLCLDLLNGFAQEQPNEQTLWMGKSAHYQLNWTTANLVATDSKGLVAFSAREAAIQGFANYQSAMEGEQVGQCSYTRKFRVLAFIGNVLTFRDELETSCAMEAHPGSSTRYSTIDLSVVLKPSTLDRQSYTPDIGNGLAIKSRPLSSVISLPQLIPESVLIRALNADPLIKKTLAAPATSVSEIRNDIGDAGIQVEKNPCSFELPEDFLTRFVFHHVQRGELAVRLQLVPIGGACRAQAADLGLLLPIPERLQPSLTVADEGKQGFLAVRAPSGTTVITFRMQTGKAQ